MKLFIALSIFNSKAEQAAMDMVALGNVDVDFLVTHRFGLDQARQAFDLVAGYRDGVVKARIHIG